MSAEDVAFDLITTWEGWRASSYPDPVTHGEPWTIGYGATGPTIGPNTVWDKERAVAELQKRIKHDLHIIDAMVIDRPMNDNQRAACCSLAYNIGLKNFEHSSVRKHWLAGEDQAAADSFLSWDKAHEAGQIVVVPGLEHRRVAERDVFLRSVSR